MAVNGQRDAHGRYAAGHRGGPGRPKGFAAVAREILRQTENGLELVRWAVERWRDAGLDDDARERAHQWLSDRGLGKPVANIELHAQLDPVNDDDDIDYDALTVDQLRELDQAERDHETRRAAIVTGASVQCNALLAIASGTPPAEDC